MGLAFPVLASGATSTSGSSLALDDYTPTVGKALILLVAAGNQSSIQPTISSISGGGPTTWTQEKVNNFDAVAATMGTMWAYKGKVTSGALGHPTITFGQSNDSFVWAVIQVDEGDADNIILQSATGGDNTSPETTPSLSTFSSSDNRGLVVYAKNVTNAALYTPDGAWVKDGNETISGPTVTMEWGHATDASVSAAWTQGAGGAAAGNIIMEVKYLAPSTPPPVTGAGQSNTFENELADGTAITPANSSQGTAGDGFDETYNMEVETDATKLLVGKTRGGLAKAPATSGAANGEAYVGWTMTDSEPTFSVTFWHPGSREGYKLIQTFIRRARGFSVFIKANGSVALRDHRNQAMATSAKGLVNKAGFYRIEGTVTIHATSQDLNSASVSIFAPHNISTPSQVLTATGGDYGSPGEEFTKIRAGKLTPTVKTIQPVLQQFIVGGTDPGGGGTGIVDTFNRADSATTMGNTDTGETWEPQDGTWGIDSNRAYLASAVLASMNEQVVDTELVDHKIEAQLITSPTSNRTRAGVIGRFASPSAYLFLEVNGITDTIELKKKVAGGITSLKSVAWPGGTVGGFNGVMNDQPTETAKVGATWYVPGDTSSIKNAGRVWNAVECGGYIYVTSWSADRVGPISGAVYTINSVYRIDATTLEADISWHPTFNATAGPSGPDIPGMCTDGTYIYIGGDFTSVNGVSHSKIARFVGTTGALDSWNPGTIAGNINTLTADPSQDVIYMGGSLSTVNGTTRNGMAAVKISDASLWSTWNPNVASGAFPIEDSVLVNHSTKGKALWVGFNGTGTVGGGGPYDAVMISGLGETDSGTTPGQVQWGLNNNTSGGHVVAASNDAQLVAFGTTGSPAGNNVWVYDYNGTNHYGSGRYISTDGDIQGLAAYKLGTGEVLLLVGTHDQSFSTGHVSSDIANSGVENGSGFAAYNMDTGAIKTWRPEFVQSPGDSSNTSPYWGGTQKVWSIKVIRPGLIMVGGIWTGAKETGNGAIGAGHSAGPSISPSPKRIAFYEEGGSGTSTGGTVPSSTTLDLSMDIQGDVVTCSVKQGATTIASFTHQLSSADAAAYGAGTKVGFSVYPSSATDDDTGSRFENLNATGGGGGVVDPPPDPGGSGSWLAESVGPYSGGGSNAIAVSPTKPGWLMDATDVGGVRESKNAGGRWEQKNRGLCDDQATLAAQQEETRRGVAAMVAAKDPTNPSKSVMLAGFGKGSAGGVAMMKEDTDTWIKLDQSIQFESQNEAAPFAERPRTVNHLITVDETNGIVYAADRRDYIWRSTDYFTSSNPTWVQIATATGHIKCLYIDPNNPSALYYGVKDNGGTATTSTGVFRIDSPQSGTSKAKTKVSSSAMAQVEDLAFASGYIYAAVSNPMGGGTAGIYRSGLPAISNSWVNLGAGAHHFLSIDAFFRPNSGGAVTVIAGCFQESPSLYRSTNGGASLGVTWSSVTAGNIGDANDYGTSQTQFFLDGSAPEVYSISHDPTTLDRWFALGGRGSYPYVSTDDGIHWTPIQDGMTIVSSNDIAMDPTRPGWGLQGNQDHDGFGTQNYFGSVTRLSRSPSTTGHAVICDSDGVWWMSNGEGQSDASAGLYRSTDGNNGGANPMTMSSVANITNTRIAALAVGYVGGSKRVVAYHNGVGMRYASAASLSPTWSTASGGPTGTITSSDLTPNMPLIWPDAANSETLFAFLRSGSGSIWRSNDGGASWTQILASVGYNVRRGYIAAKSPDVFYYTDTSGNLFRVRNATTVTSGTFTANRDLIAGVNDAAAIKFGIDGSLLVFCVPTGSHDCRVLRAVSPANSGDIAFTDIADPTDGGANSVGQQLFYANAIAGDATHVYVSINGGATMRFSKVA